jgi:simple sugar transport system permease protein
MGEDFGASYGFTGIAVALLARNSAIGALPAALLFAALAQGGGVMEGTVGISSSLVDFIQGMMIVLVLAATTVLYAARRRSRVPDQKPKPEPKAPAQELRPAS